MRVEIVLELLFKKLGIRRDSLAMFHGDAGALHSLNQDRDRVTEIVDDFLEYFAPVGTLIVPTFTYSATKSETFNPAFTPSRIGQFSEAFRTNKRMQRTLHPNFSVSVTGLKSCEVLNSRVDDAFGTGTLFDLLYQENADLVTIGCSLNSITFAHYVEQAIGVPYRFMKTFSAIVEEEKVTRSFETTYYVRDLDLGFKTALNLARFRENASINHKIKVASLGRFECTAIKARDCFAIMSEMLSKDVFSLIRGGNT